MAPRRHNTQTPNDRRKLLEDFQGRLRYNEEQGDFRHWLRRPNSLAWVVHPLADETDLLAELAVGPEECRFVDAYWRYRDSVYFLQFKATTVCASEPGISYRFDRQHRQDEFVVVVPRDRIETADYHRVLAWLEELIDAGVIERERSQLPFSEDRWICAREPLGPVLDCANQGEAGNDVPASPRASSRAVAAKKEG